MKHVHKILIAVFIISTAVIFLSFQYVSNKIADIDRSDYLVSLRENSTVGCSSFNQLKNDILVIGDSHAYAGIDFYRLKELTGSQKISSCTMGGLYFETLIELLKKIEAGGNYPTNIIYGLSLRQFTTGSDKEQQIAEHHKLINSIGYIDRNAFLNIKTNFLNYFDDEHIKHVLVNERSNLLAYWVPLINNLDKNEVNRVFEELDHSAKHNWRKYLNQLKFINENKSNIERFCKLINKIETNLFLVDIPESPFLQRQYKSAEIEDYKNVIAMLNQCSKKVVKLTNEEWGIEARHFLNRSLNKSFNFDEIVTLTNKAPDLQRSIAFDLDHINLVGAQIVTEKIYNEIKSDLKYAF